MDIVVEVVPALSTINRVPEITAEDKTLMKGESFAVLTGVTASDKEDGDLTDKIEVIENNVDTSKAGTYKVTYKVTDSQGASAVRIITVTVKEKAGVLTPDNVHNSTNDTSGKNHTTQTAAQTGDNTNLFMWMTLSILSAAGILFAVLFRQKQQQ